MIYYISSYPRSGNAWVRNLIKHQFGFLSTSVHGDGTDGEQLKIWYENKSEIKQYQIITPKKKDLYGLVESNPLYRRMASFVPPDGKKIKHRTLLPGLKTLFLDGSIRKQLASESETYFIKTHFLPYDEYFPGEYIVHIIRNAGACLWSYYRFRKDVLAKPVTLDNIVLGNVAFGHWGKYESQWALTADKLGVNFLLVKFESLLNNELAFCEKIAPFLQLPVISTDIKPFEFFHQQRPNLARAGKASGWEVNYSKAQLAALWKEHGETMARFSYGEPNYQAGLDQALY
jgi:hypothetical protein